MHYYIHLTEASRTPELALPYADMLKDEMPGVGHMVHMSTHMYQRNGLYAKGVSVNEEANTDYNKEDVTAPMLGIGQNTILHIFAVQSFCAMDAGIYGKGLPIYMRARDRCVAAKPAFEQDPYSQFIYMLPAIANIRFGKWDEITHAAARIPGGNMRLCSIILQGVWPMFVKTTWRRPGLTSKASGQTSAIAC